MRISVITAQYSVTGVPRAQARLATALARQGHQVDYVIGGNPHDLEIPEPEGARLVVLGVASARRSIMPIRRYLRSQKPDVVFSAEDHLNAAVSIAALLALSEVRISGSSRVSPYDTYSDTPLTKGWYLKRLFQSVAWRQNVRTCVSYDMVEQYKQIMPSLLYHGAYNIVCDKHSEILMNARLDDPWFPKAGRAGSDGFPPVIVAAGSLESRKGFPDLINAVGLLHKAGKPVRLIILGEGSQRPELEGLVKVLGLEAAVRMPGEEQNPWRYYRRATIFALSSYAEGLPNVLIEAMSAGATPVATDCPTGPREALQDGAYGYLAKTGDPASLAECLVAALERPIPPEQLSIAVAPFTEKAVLARHSELLGLPLLA